jgi:hypothetical protein
MIDVQIDQEEKVRRGALAVAESGQEVVRQRGAETDRTGAIGAVLLYATIFGGSAWNLIRVILHLAK